MDSLGPSRVLLKEVVDCYRKYLGESLVSMVLFGSRARGEATEASDYDLFIIAKGLPTKPFRRKLFIRRPLEGQFEGKLCIIAKTPEEVTSAFPSLFLDLSLDGMILYDRDEFFEDLQKKIKKIIGQAGLRRRKDGGEYYWEWQKPPRGGWEITWSGYREL
jgi:predicted nucleotidyltransferase